MKKAAKIVIIEEDLPMLHSIAFTLKRQGYAVCAFSDGKAALKKLENVLLKEDGVSLVIMDIQQSRMDGFELARAVRAISGEVPMVFITSDAKRETLERFNNLGRTEVLYKPFTSEQLLVKAQSIVSDNNSL